MRKYSEVGYKTHNLETKSRSQGYLNITGILLVGLFVLAWWWFQPLFSSYFGGNNTEEEVVDFNGNQLQSSDGLVSYQGDSLLFGREIDSDQDGIADLSDPDDDNDGIPDGLDTDDNNNGVEDGSDSATQTIAFLTQFFRNQTINLDASLLPVPYDSIVWQEVDRSPKISAYRSGDIKANADGTLRIIQNAITSREILRHSIESDDISTNSVTSRTIRNGTIVGDDVSRDANLTINSLAVNNIDSINGVSYQWTNTQGSADATLINDGDGGLSWGTLGSGSITADSLDFTEFQDQLDLDTSTDILADGSEVLSITNTGTGYSFLVNDDAGDTSPFVINASGSVGIGTTTPIRKVHLYDDVYANLRIRFESPELNSDYSIIDLGLDNTDVFQLRTRNSAGVSQKIIFSAKLETGNFGLQVANPTAALQIGATRSIPSWTTTGALLAVDTLTVTDTSGSGTIAARVANSFGRPLFSSSNAVTLTDAATVYINNAPNASTNTTITNGYALWIDAGNTRFDGNLYLPTAGSTLGIGTATPASNLDVSATTGGVTTLSRFDTSVSASDMIGRLQFYAADTSTTTNFVVANIEAQATNTVTTDINPGRLIFRTTGTGLAATPSERMRIDESGNVGIGTTSPGSKLTVNGRLGISRVSPAQADLGWISYADQVNGLSIGTDSSGNPITFFTNGTEKLRLENGGNFGVGGDTTPDSLFSVGSTSQFQVNSSGAIAAATGITSSGTITFSGLTTDGIVTVASGVLSSSATLGSSYITADTLDFTEFQDQLDLDASTDILADGSEVFSITNSGTGNSFLVNDVASDTTPFVIDASGNVGIGTTVPSATLHVVGNITSPGAGTNSEKFGLNALAAGNTSVAFGNGASSSATDTIAIGYNASASSADAIAIGASASAINGSVGIGETAATGGLSVAIGTSTLAGNNAIAIGYDATASADGTIALGRGATGAAVDLSGFQFVAGSSSFPTTHVYFGKGVSNAAPTAYTIHGTAGTGSNIAGANINIAGGRGTGSGTGGSIVFQTAPAGASGAVNNVLLDRVTILESGNFGIGDTTPASLFTVGSGDLFQVNSGGAIAAATGITSSGTITFSGLTTDGIVTVASGVLSSSATLGSSYITADSLDFTEFQDQLDLDASTDILADGSEVFSITNTGTGDSFVVNDASGDTSPFVINASGNVGIRIAAPANNLHLYGSMTIQEDTATNTLTTLADADLGRPGLEVVSRAADGWSAGIHVYRGAQTSGGFLTSLFAGRSDWSAGIRRHSTGSFYATETAGAAISQSNGVISFSYGTGLTVGSTATLTESMRITSTGLGIGDTSPSAMLTVGSGDLFQVNSGGAIAAATGITSSGTITFSGLTAGGVVQAAAGTGVLSVGTLGASSITADSLDFTEFQDQLDLDASTDILADGSEVFSITNSGTGNSFVVNDASGDTTSFVIDNAGNVIVGGAASHSSGRFDILDDTGSNAQLAIAGYTNNDVGSELELRKARGTLASPTTVSTSDTLGFLRFKGYNASLGDFSTAAGIFSYADGTWASAGDTSDSPGALVLFTTPDGSSTGTNRLVISAAGHTTFGTSNSASAKVHITSDDAEDELLIGDDIAAGDDASSRITLGNTDGSSFIRAGQGASNYLSFGWVYNATAADAYVSISTVSGSNPVVIQRDGGNVGIGDTSPENRLTVSGTQSDTVSILGLQSGNEAATFNNGAQIAFGYNGTDDYQHFISTRHNAANSSNAIDFYVSDGTQNNTVTSGSTHVMSLVSGSVGIGDTSPDFELDVKGTICQDTNGDEVCDGAVSSDARLKTNVVTISGEEALNGLAQLRGVMFDWDENKSQTLYLGRDTRQVGLIAQEVENVFPSLIYKDMDGYRMVDYQKLTGPLISAVNELNLRTGMLQQTASDLELKTDENIESLADLQTSVDAQLATASGAIINLNDELTDFLGRMENIETDVEVLQGQILELQENQNAGVNNEEGIFENGISVTGLALFNSMTNFIEGVIFDKAAQFNEGFVATGLSVFEGKVAFDKDTAGHITLPSGETKIAVTFEDSYPNVPVVTITPNQQVEASYYVTDVTEAGFIVKINQSADEDIQFSWHAVLVAEE